MLRSNRGMVVVVGGGCLLGLTLALSYVFYWGPKLKAEASQEEVQLWGLHWADAHACLLGPNPPSSDPMEAILARELIEPGVSAGLKHCVAKLKLLRREDGASSEDMGIERAWYNLQVPVSKLAQEHAWITARTPNKSGRKLRRNLARAIGDLDASYALLRSAARLKPVPPADASFKKAVPVLTLGGPGKGESQVSNLRLDNEAVHYTAINQSGRFRASLAQGANAIEFRPVSPLALLAVGGDWGLWLESDGIPVQDQLAGAGAAIIAGPVDGDGEPGGDGATIYTLRKNERVQLSFASGSGKRTLLFRLVKDDNAGGFEWAYKLFHSTDSGGTWAEHTLPTGEMWTSLSDTGSKSYIVSTKAEAPMTLNLRILDNKGMSEHNLTFPGSRGPEDTWPPDQCLAPNRVWWVLGGVLYSMGSDGELISVSGQIEQLTDHYSYEFQCGDSFAGVHALAFADQKEPAHYQACTLEGCSPIIPTKAPSGGTVTKQVFHQGAWISIHQLDEVVAIWDGGKATSPKRLLRLAKPGPITAVASWGDALVFVVWPEDGSTPSLLRAE